MAFADDRNAIDDNAGNADTAAVLHSIFLNIAKKLDTYIVFGNGSYQCIAMKERRSYVRVGDCALVHRILFDMLVEP